MFIGLFHRCENRLVNIASTTSKIYSICDDNKYLSSTKNLSNVINELQANERPRLCNVAGNPYGCVYSSVSKVLISTTIIGACALALALVFVYSHLLLNQFKYKTHLAIASVTLLLLLLAFLSILTTLIVLGSTMSYDLFEYRYSFSARWLERSIPTSAMRVWPLAIVSDCLF